MAGEYSDRRPGWWCWDLPGNELRGGHVRRHRYVWDEDRDLYLRLNKALVTVDPVTERQDIQEIRTMLTEHVEATGSPKAREILDHLEEKAACFKKILPRDYDRNAAHHRGIEAQGLSHEQAEVEAFSASTKE